jgi:AGCS family alanine or glycine:cation symporter
LLTGTWNNPEVGLGINQIAEGFAQYIPWSSIILAACAFMFAFGTILGNAFNGSQCYLYLTKKRWVNAYFLVVAFIVFWGAVAPVALVWTISDFFIIPVALANLIGLLSLSVKRSDLLRVK